MIPTLQPFMNEIIDYAGMFPPSGLPFDEAFTNYLSYNDHTCSSFLSRFIIPAGVIPKVSGFDEEIRKRNRTVPFSILLPPAESREEFISEITKKLKPVHDLKAYFQGLVSTDVLETRIPLSVAEADRNEIKETLLELISTIIDADLNVTHLFVETHFSDDWLKTVPVFIKSISEINEKHDLPLSIGFKLRCGGTEAHQFPDIQQVALAIEECEQHKLAMKFTAGLHHPIRHFNESVDTKMHGFINVFGAAALLFHNKIDASDLPLILSDEHDGSFIFDDQFFSWKQASIPTKQIIEARDRFCMSYGSCSFIEPIEDLTHLNLL